MKKKLTTIIGITCAVAWVLLLFPSLASAQNIELTPTFESIGIVLRNNNVTNNARCKVEFRKAGEQPWRDGLDLFVDKYTDEKGFRGSIVLLEPNTKYEVKLCYTTNGGECQTLPIKTITTWNEDFPVAETIPVSSREDLMKKLKSGSSAGYVVFDGGGSLIKGTDKGSVLDIEGMQYVILQNMKFTKSNDHGIRISESKNIVVQNCEIYKWGREGAFCDTERFGYVGGGTLGGIFVRKSSRIVVQRNIIRDPTGTSCYWGSLDGKVLKKGESDHPAGPRGIALAIVSESVFRYNEIYAVDKNHYFSDIFNGETSITGGEGVESDIDVYGNEFSNGWDDGIEIEGKNKNIRVWNNVIHNVYQGVASDRNDSRTYYGPVYIWRNVITNLAKNPTDKEGRYAGFKLDNQKGKGGIYLFNNTVSGLGGKYKKPSSTISNGPQYNLMAKNNIFEVNSSRSYKDDTKKEGKYVGLITGELDYNAFSHGKSDYMVKKKWEKHSQFGVSFKYKKGEREWDYYAQNNGNSKAQNAGTRIPNFIETPDGKAPDLGAAQKDVWSMCVGINGSRNCSNGTNNPPPPAEPLPEPDIAPIQATYAPFRNQFGYSFFSIPRTFWVTAPTYTFSHPRGNTAEGSDNQITLKAVWDQEYLSVAVEVIDNETVAVDTDKPFQNDGIELLFDVKNKNASAWEGNPQEHKQFIVDFNKKTLVKPEGFAVEVRRADITTRSPEHRYEVRIPWTSLGIERPTVGLEIGFDVANNDRDETGEKVHFTYTGRDTNFLVPGKFARLELVDTPPVKVSTPSGEITIDGKLDEQDWDYTQAENGVSKYDFPKDSGFAYSKMLWTPEYLYIGIKVIFDEWMIQDPTKPWLNDGMEALFDTENTRSTSWDNTKGHKQLIVDIDGNMYQDPGEGKPGNLAAIVAQSREQDSSAYTIEMAIPWSNLGKENPKLGDKMRFDLVHNDRDPDQYTGVTLSGRFYGPEANFKMPSEFAELVLVETFNIFQARSGFAEKTAVVTPGAEVRQLLVYPNPSAEGHAHLQLSGFGEQAQVQIVDAKGQVIYQGVHTESQINLAQRFPGGLYVVRVSDARGSLTQKLLIE